MLPGNILHIVHTSCHPTLQHHNSYNRTDNYRQWNAVGSPDDGHKDAKHVEILLITNKSLFVASSWFLLYLLIKDARSFKHKVNVLLFPGPKFLHFNLVTAHHMLQIYYKMAETIKEQSMADSVVPTQGHILNHP